MKSKLLFGDVFAEHKKYRRWIIAGIRKCFCSFEEVLMCCLVVHIEIGEVYGCMHRARGHYTTFRRIVSALAPAIFNKILPMLQHCFKLFILEFL